MSSWSMNPISRNSLSINELNPSGQELHVIIANVSRTQSSQAPPLNLARQGPPDGLSREEYLKICADLYNASTEGDWKVAKDIFEKRKELVRFSITKRCETTLHVAVSNRKTEFVWNLMKLMEKEDLKLQDNNSYTALCIAVTVGDIHLAQILLEKNKDQLNIPNSEGMIPLQMAASFGRYHMVKFLYKNTESMPDDFWTPESRGCFLLACIKGTLFDIALRVLKDHLELAVSEGSSLLKVLAQIPQEFVEKPTSFGRMINMHTSFGRMINMYTSFTSFIPPTWSWDECQALQLLRVILKNITKLPWTEIYDIMRGPADPINDENMPTSSTDATRKYSSSVLFLAAEAGNIVFIIEIIRLYPELLEEINDINQSIFHVAVSYRHADIYGLLDYVGSTKDHIVTLEDKNGNNMLHLVGMYTDSAKRNSDEYISGPAIEMQREISWFEEVESMFPLSLREKKNAIGYTPREEFTRYHRGLVYEGEKWMKDIGTQLMVVAALLATISFAAAITFAGGYNQDTGFPMFGNTNSLQWFIINNSLAFVLASASILNVLSLLTSRYEERDFSRKLPFTLMLSIGTVFLSILCMFSAFALNLSLVFKDTPRNIAALSFAISFSPLLLFSHPIYHLFTYIFLTTYLRIWKMKVRYNRSSVPPMEYIVL